jgi:membrane-bound metal-dependent hydrolase YbcI (DUF457 family)
VAKSDRRSFSMPITPFHFGLGAALHAAVPKHISFISFCAANVLIDFESLYNLWYGRHPVHAFLHTYVGATLIIVATTSVFLALRWFASRFWLPDLFAWQLLTWRPVAVGAAFGAYSHIVFDSVMHEDIRPLAPFSDENLLYAAIPLDALHLLCLALAAVGALVLGWRKLQAGTKNIG